MGVVHRPLLRLREKAWIVFMRIASVRREQIQEINVPNVASHAAERQARLPSLACLARNV